MNGKLEAIYVATSHDAPQESMNQGILSPATGLVGDRHAGTDAIVSLIEAEQVEQFNQTTGLSITAGDTRRNLVTRGVDLNALVGKRFRLGDAELEGFELCDPCAELGTRLQTAEVSAAAVVKALVDRAGLRAYVRAGGPIRPGSPISF